MAQSAFATHQYTSEHFGESCGAILFDLSGSQIEVCLVYHMRTNEWYLAKGRRNQQETRQEAAIREVVEETGYKCHLHPVTMPTRAQPPNEVTDVPDHARVFADITEPFMFTIRAFDAFNVKLIWWYIAALDEGARMNPLIGEVAFKPQFFAREEALEKLTYQADREVLRKAFELVEGKGHHNVAIPLLN